MASRSTCDMTSSLRLFVSSVSSVSLVAAGGYIHPYVRTYEVCTYMSRSTQMEFPRCPRLFHGQKDSCPDGGPGLVFVCSSPRESLLACSPASRPADSPPKAEQPPASVHSSVRRGAQSGFEALAGIQ